MQTADETGAADGYDARAVANFILLLGEQRQRPISKMTLLKLMYFAHGWCLAIHNRPLVKDRFEAWKYGPVVRSVFDCFRHVKSKYVQERAKRLDFESCEWIEVPAHLRPEDQLFVEKIFLSYAYYSAFELSDMTHTEGSPWDQIWNAEFGKVSPGMIISDDSIKTHFLSYRSPRLRA